LISKPKSFKIKPPIPIKHFIWINPTNYSNNSITHSIPNSYIFYNIYYIYAFTFQSQTNPNLLKTKKSYKKIWDWWPRHPISRSFSLGFYWQFKLAYLIWTWTDAPSKLLKIQWESNLHHIIWIKNLTIPLGP